MFKGTQNFKSVERKITGLSRGSLPWGPTFTSDLDHLGAIPVSRVERPQRTASSDLGGRRGSVVRGPAHGRQGRHGAPRGSAHHASPFAGPASVSSTPRAGRGPCYEGPRAAACRASQGFRAVSVGASVFSGPGVGRPWPDGDSGGMSGAPVGPGSRGRREEPSACRRSSRWVPGVPTGGPEARDRARGVLEGTLSARRRPIAPPAVTHGASGRHSWRVRPSPMARHVGRDVRGGAGGRVSGGARTAGPRADSRVGPSDAGTRAGNVERDVVTPADAQNVSGSLRT